MNNILGAVKLLSLTIISGAIGAGLIFMALDSDEVLGAAAGKKAAKKKKKQSNVWNQVANELNPTPIPTIPVQQPAASNLEPVRENLQVELPDEPLQDPRDPELCASNVLVQNNGEMTRTILRAEVRGYHQELGEDKILCEVVVYPRGCDQSYTLNVFNRWFNDQVACQTLGAQHKNRKQVFIEVKSYELDYGHGGKQRKDVINSFSLQDMTMDQFLNRVANYDRRAQVREANGLSDFISNGLNGLKNLRP